MALAHRRGFPSTATSDFAECRPADAAIHVDAEALVTVAGHAAVNRTVPSDNNTVLGTSLGTGGGGGLTSATSAAASSATSPSATTFPSAAPPTSASMATLKFWPCLSSRCLLTHACPQTLGSGLRLRFGLRHW